MGRSFNCPPVTELYRSLFVAVAGLLTGLLLYSLIASRRGRDRWTHLRVLLPVVDLVGTWLGAAGVVALFLGRVAYTVHWAVAMGLFAMMIAVTLYQRAVLLPSLESAYKRMQAGEEWEADWRFLWRMGVIGRAFTAASVLAALVCGLLA